MTTSLDDSIAVKELLKELIFEGLEGFRPIFQKLFNEAMKIERQEYLNAKPYERTDSRKGQANGFKDKTLNTRMGSIKVQIPQVRGLSFYPQSLEKGTRSEVALKAAIAEMYVQGVSTRRVTEITEQLCGLEISSTQVSKLTKELDEELNLFRNRQLGKYRFLILDARYEQIRNAGIVRDLAVLIAIGINEHGKREILGVSVSLSEAEVHWRSFLESLVSRGLSGLWMIISDAHEGLKAARKALFPSVPWQRCQFHLAQNARHYAPKISMRDEISDDVRYIFNSTSLPEATQKMKEIVTKYQDSAPDFSAWVDENIEEGLTVFSLPLYLQKRLRTTNMIERLNQEIKRRTRVARLFPNSDSCLRLVSAILQETHEKWFTDKRYLNFEKLDSLENPFINFYRKLVA